MTNYEKIRADVAKKYNVQLAELKTRNHSLQTENEQLKTLNSELQEKIRMQEEWIDRLLEYTELSKDELQEIAKTSKSLNQASEAISGLFNHFSVFGLR